MRSEGLPMTARLVLIGLVAGVFSTLFGVGGGIIVVPLLVAVAAFPTHAAAATSLGAILVTAAAGVVLYAVRGEVRPWYAAARRHPRRRRGAGRARICSSGSPDAPSASASRGCSSSSVSG